MHQRTHALCAPPFDGCETWDLGPGTCDLRRAPSLCSPLQLAHSRACSTCCCEAYSIPLQRADSPQPAVASARGTSYLPTSRNIHQLAAPMTAPGSTTGLSLHGRFQSQACIPVVPCSGPCPDQGTTGPVDLHSAMEVVTSQSPLAERRGPPSRSTPAATPAAAPSSQSCLQSRSRASLKHHAAGPCTPQISVVQGPGARRRFSSPLILADPGRFADVGSPSSTFSISLPRLVP